MPHNAKQIAQSITGLSLLLLLLVGCERAQPGTPVAEASEIPNRPITRPAFLDVLAHATGDGLRFAPGSSFPLLTAEGWINGSPLSADQSCGTIRVIEVWAYW